MDKIYNCILDIFIEKRIKKAYLCLQEVAKTRNSFLWFIRVGCVFLGAGRGDEYWKEGCAKLFVRRHTVESVHTETGWNIYAGSCLLSSCVQTARGPPLPLLFPLGHLSCPSPRIIPPPLCRIFVSSASTYGASIREFVTTAERAKSRVKADELSVSVLRLC